MPAKILILLSLSRIINFDTMKFIMIKFRKFMKNVRTMSREVYRVGSKDGDFMKAENRLFDDWKNEQHTSPARD